MEKASGSTSRQNGLTYNHKRKALWIADCALTGVAVAAGALAMPLLPIVADTRCGGVAATELEGRRKTFEEGRHLTDLGAIGGEAYRGLGIDEKGLEESSATR